MNQTPWEQMSDAELSAEINRANARIDAVEHTRGSLLRELERREGFHCQSAVAPKAREDIDLDEAREEDREAIALALFRRSDRSRGWASFGEHVHDYWLGYADEVLALGFRRPDPHLEEEPDFRDSKERVKCRGCGSLDTQRIGRGSRLIAIDDAVEYENWHCVDCDREWER